MFDTLLGVPLIIALVELLKLFSQDKRFYAPAAVLLGTLLYLGVGLYYGADPVEAALKGLAAGLAAVGLYSGAKNTLTAG